MVEMVEPDDLVSFGLIPELIGRLQVLCTLKELEEGDLVRILTEPKNALIRQYETLFAMDRAKLTITDDGLLAIAQLAIKRKTGARGLRAIMEELLIELMYDLPELEGYEVVINKEVVDKKSAPVKIKMGKSTKSTKKESA
jgi:ATP-dependent Clp protease ATP-binding subunit ClpX